MVPTKVPRWAAWDADGDAVGEAVVPLSPGMLAALHRLSADESAETQSLLLAPLVKVLAEITAERHVAVGHLAPRAEDRGVLHALQTEIPDGSWRDLVTAVTTGRTQGVARRGAAEPFDIVLDLSRTGGDDGPGEPVTLAPDTALHVALVTGDHPALHLHHRTRLVDTAYAHRLGGYFRTALDHLTASLDADHATLDLPSEQEREHHLHGLAGPVVPLPDAMFPALFEERARAHPDAVAVSRGDVSWDYRTLDAAANRVAAALLRHGLQPEDVVAVVMDRTLDWAATLLGVLKAGGTYLPVRPDFPAQRVATQLQRSDCRLVVAEQPARDLVRATDPEGQHARTTLFAEDLLHGDDDPGSPNTRIAPGQSAYVYFTSGSTGAPKGAQCEHAGMINHLYAKIDSVGLRAGDVVTQTASQCFDISLWQLIAPWLVGAAARIVDTDTQLDPERFLDELAGHHVSVAQLVPSYFEILLGLLERTPRDLGALRSISVTGEALKLDPVRRWFAVQPGVQLVNAYGATEVSDDTMHEVLTAPPVRDFVSVGTSLRNVRTYILDARGRLAPLGSPGEIVFAGVSVGRGYINDPERTREAFVPDPFVPGDRMYRTGDFGRWLPEGTIEYLGRRDQQVKVRGFRIEIGEIENKLRTAPGVLDCAVVVDPGAGTGADKSLAAFYVASGPAEEPELRAHLSALLPDYMVPAHLHRLDAMPLNENGKTDKRTLTELAETLGHALGSRTAPGTPTERWLATEWAEALGVPLERIGRDDHFFHLGGTSLTAVRFVVKLDRAISLKQLIGTPVLSDLAALLDAGADSRPADHALLQPLTDPLPEPLATLVCFPYAGGNAVNFRVLAERLAEHGIAVLGVELPAHDVTVTPEQPQDVEEIARRVQGELLQRADGPLMLWGHCAGSSHALATARLLEASGAGPTDVFLGALLLDPVADLQAEIDEVDALTPRQITERLMVDSSYVELDRLKPERATLVGSAYQHDVRSTNTHLMQLHADPAPHRIGAPVHVVIAADDSTTKGGTERYRDWSAIADDVTLHELPDGGHYFISTRAADIAALVTQVRTAAGRPAH
ncbi:MULTISPECIES: amino acid adenylation domain-containing protein [unclassified Streptomyces]|uniref:non-ribosomal peptide synthetase n=1 Tax=unclassified Streptomyces TaxID=2593676 RepID=UPI000DD9F939|nr:MULTISPECIES: amino acid adenylation domain-containing protein [unclassified Streptomyces]QZZ31114.1 amino acid adenylation domain-containing protein [Streptomyces sp. ST1015]